MKLLSAGIVLTLAILAGHRLLPARSMDLIGHRDDAGFLLLNAGSGADAPVQWVDASRLHWRCRYASYQTYEPCVLSFPLTQGDPSRGLDLSRFDSIELELSYQGPAPFLHLDVRNFDPRFSRVGDGNSARMQAVTLRRRDIAQPIRIRLSELTVPDWWVQAFNLPREFNQPNLDNAVSLSIGVPGDLTGQLHDLELHRVVLKGDWIGADRVYECILLAWLAGAAWVVLRAWTRMRHAHMRQQREIDALTARTRQLRVEQDGLRRLATVDELTGVLNRRGLEQAMADLEEAAQGFSLVVLDVDHFKHVNDRYGHDSGDEVLRRVAAVVAGNLRDSDVVGRWGGEEFLVVFLQARARDAARLADKLRVRIEDSEIICSSRRIAVTASFGVALAPPGSMVSDAFKRADAALYRAKAAGRNRVEIDKTLDRDAPTTV